MLDKLRSYLVSLPTPTTSPLYLAVNTVAVLAGQGSAASISVLDTDETGYQATSYLRVYEKPDEARPVERFLGGINIVSKALVIECNAYGSTAAQAEGRAEDLSRVARTVLENTKSAVQAGALTRLDPNNSAKYDKVVNWLVDPWTPSRTGGPGAKVSEQLWTAKRGAKLEVWIVES
jgi:hypothetical protein